MYAFLLRCLPAPLANLAITCWYASLLFLLWLKWGGDTLPGFRYGQI